MPDPPSPSNYNQTNNQNEKMYINDTRSYSSNPTSTYSTLKDSYRSYSGTTRESSPPYASSSNYGTLKNESRNSNNDDYEKKSFSPIGNIDFIDDDIPYHARQTSQPFSYGATTDMIKHQKLSSPSLVRKVTLRGQVPVVDFDDVIAGDNNSQRPITPLSPNTPDPPPEFANGSRINDHVDGYVVAVVVVFFYFILYLCQRNMEFYLHINLLYVYKCKISALIKIFEMFSSCLSDKCYYFQNFIIVEK